MSTFVGKCLSVLSYFQGLVYFQHLQDHFHYCDAALHDIITSCKQLKCLLFNEKYSTHHSLNPSHSCTLEQLSITSNNLDVTTDFMASISSHGRLVHVVLQVKSVTSEGIAALVTNSPDLLTFHAFLDGVLLDQDLYQNLKAKIPDRMFFKCGSYKVAGTFSSIALHHVYEPHAESADLTLDWW